MAQRAKAKMKRLVRDPKTGRMTKTKKQLRGFESGAGRKRDPNALTNAERQRAYRDRKRGKAPRPWNA
jgi:hypothetical protein